MDVEERIEVLKRRPTEEIITVEELRQILETKSLPVAYDGFEGSGIPHIGTGLLKALKVKDLSEAGVKHIFFLADFHSYLNRKFGGDLTKIRVCYELFKHCWHALLNGLNVDPSFYEFKFGSEVYDNEYWQTVLTISKEISITRLKRALTIAGRTEFEAQDAAALFYVVMQVADIFHLEVDICQLGMDQRKANILAREIGPKLGLWKPVCIHHHLLMGLQEPKKMGFEENHALDVQVSSKMSKSLPETCIFVTDEPDIIKSKILKAYCPPKETINNPILDIISNIILRGTPDDKFTIERPGKFGGPITYYSYEDLERDYRDGRIHPLDLKIAVAAKLSELLKPCREHFKNNREAAELLQMVRNFNVTR